MYTRRPRARVAAMKVQNVIDAVVQHSLDPANMPELVVNCNGISGEFRNGITPCITAARGQQGGFWLVQQGRMMTVSELLRLQGIHPSAVDVSMLSKNKMGFMIGNGFTLGVVCRIFARVMPIAGLAMGIKDPYAVFQDNGAYGLQPECVNH